MDLSRLDNNKIFICEICEKLLWVDTDKKVHHMPKRCRFYYNEMKQNKYKKGNVVKLGLK